ncbi:MAG: dephospho-CoA kinase [Culturomica sp.]|jgi:dephospho-CoA kinase|nr:dephospho-CoA kinase [Culturomica sp.]
MLKIGLTGGIGSGKSTVANIFLNLGFPVYISDIMASIIMQEDSNIRMQLRNHFGESIFNSDESLNKKKLAGIIFNDPDELGFVNSIIHPAVMKDFEDWCTHQDSQLVVFESAILFEGGFEQLFDYVVCVNADEELRIQRVMRRDNVSRNAVIERIQNQMDAREKCMKSDFVIETNGEMDLKKQVNAVIMQIIK